jgi:nucleotidyltransferase/DNA polymerase involved in DNA repair
MPARRECSVKPFGDGVSFSKTLAKLVSDMKKPDGVT